MHATLQNNFSQYAETGTAKRNVSVISFKEEINAMGLKISSRQSNASLKSIHLPALAVLSNHDLQTMIENRGGSRNFDQEGRESGEAGPWPTNQRNLYFEVIRFTDLAPFRHTKPGFLDCSFSGVSKKWSAIFVRCIVPEIYLGFWSLPELYHTSVLF